MSQNTRSPVNISSEIRDKITQHIGDGADGKPHSTIHSFVEAAISKYLEALKKK